MTYRTIADLPRCINCKSADLFPPGVDVGSLGKGARRCAACGMITTSISTYDVGRAAPWTPEKYATDMLRVMPVEEALELAHLRCEAATCEEDQHYWDRVAVAITQSQLLAGRAATRFPDCASPVGTNIGLLDQDNQIAADPIAKPSHNSVQKCTVSQTFIERIMDFLHIK